MGYDTRFDGHFDLDKPLKPEHAVYLHKFNTTRRVKRNAKLTEKRSDPVREAVGLPIGEEGEFFVGEGGLQGQGKGEDIIDYNCPSSNQPGLWCDWTIGDSKGKPPKWDATEEEIKEKEYKKIVYDEGEKFYNYIEWLQYIIENFLKPWGYTLNGKMKWRGEDFNDYGTIFVKDNEVKIYYH